MRKLVKIRAKQCQFCKVLSKFKYILINIIKLICFKDRKCPDLSVDDWERSNCEVLTRFIQVEEEEE